MRLLVLILSVFLTTPVFADSFTVTGGFWQVFGTGNTVALNLSGPGFTAASGDIGVGGLESGFGQPGTFYQHQSGLSNPANLTIHGRTLAFGEGDVNLRLFAPLALPSTFTPDELITVQGPAVLFGTLLANDFAAGTVTTHTLTGAGLATARFFGMDQGDIGPDLWAFTGLRVDFGPTLNAVPEPSTWMLFVTGVMFLWYRTVTRNKMVRVG